jgi:Tfp pilus assembly protein PilZ
MADKEPGIHRRYKVGARNRKGARIPIAVDVEIGGAKGGAMGRARDITVEGIQIRSPHSYAVGERLAITLHIPKFAQHFDFVAKVAWVEPAGSMEEFQIGCTFVHTTESQKLLKNLLWELASGNIPEILRAPGKKTTRRDLRK